MIEKKRLTGNINDKSKDGQVYTGLQRSSVFILKFNFDVIIDTTNLKKELRRGIIEYVRSQVPNVVFKYKLMALDVELAINRVKTQIKNGENRANVHEDVIRNHASLYRQMLEDIKEEGLIKLEE